MSADRAKKREDIRPVVWPTKEPDVLPPPERPAQQAQPEVRAEPSEDPGLPAGVLEDSSHAFVYRHAREAAAVVRTLIRRDEGAGTDQEPLAGMTTRQVVAALLSGLGVEVGAAVVGHLKYGEEDGEFVAGALAGEPEVTHATAMAVLEMVRQRIVAGDYLVEGGPGYAHELLETAHGGYRADRLIQRGTRTTEPRYDWLRQVPPERLAPFISHEHPQTQALILSQLDPMLSGAVLALLPERLQSDVSYRMATLQDVTPAALEEIDEALEHGLRDVIGRNQTVGGPKVLADTLNCAGAEAEANVLKQLDGQVPEVAEAVRNLMFVFADLDKLTDRELGEVAGAADAKIMATALKVADEQLRERILANASESRRAEIQKETEQLDALRLSQVEEAQLRVVQHTRQLEEHGKLTIVRGEPDDRIIEEPTADGE